jgi:hypothetical protein
VLEVVGEIQHLLVRDLAAFDTARFALTDGSTMSSLCGMVASPLRGVVGSALSVRRDGAGR